MYKMLTTKIMTIWHGEGIKERRRVFFHCYVGPSGAWWQIKINLLLFLLHYNRNWLHIKSILIFHSQLQIYETKIPHLFSDPTDSVPGDMAVPAIWKTILSFPMCTVATILRDKDGLSSTIDCHSLFLCNLNIYNLSRNKFEHLKQNPVYLTYSSQPLEIIVLTKLNPLPI